MNPETKHSMLSVTPPTTNMPAVPTLPGAPGVDYQAEYQVMGSMLTDGVQPTSLHVILCPVERRIAFSRADKIEIFTDPQHVHKWHTGRMLLVTISEIAAPDDNL